MKSIVHISLNPPFTKGDLAPSSLLPPLEKGGRGGFFIAGGEPPLAHARLACARTGWKAGATI